MPITVFYSWQSELCDKSNRYFIRDAMKEVLRNIRNDCDLDERPTIDHDTKGIPGSPDITKTIFDKIEICSAFVADVSFTSESPNGRKCPNPNVLIELGFALHALGSERLILVMNDSFGSPKEIPFNLAGRRWPITYTLQPDAGSETQKIARINLTQKIKDALTDMVNSEVLFSAPFSISSIQTDRVLFRKLLEQFPANGETAVFLRDHELSALIPGNLIKLISFFIREWDGALHEFIDPTLEKVRKEFLHQLSLFISELCGNIWELEHNPVFYSMELKKIDLTHPRWKKYKELQEMASKAYKLHQELIRICKQKLGLPNNS